MRKINNALIVGAGAVGAGYASIIHASDPEAVSIAASKERVERYKEKGFIINGKRFDFNYIAFEEASRPADLIIISVKNHHLDEAIRQIEGFVGKDTIILSLLNGISSEETIGRVYGEDKLLYSLSVGIDAVREGNSITFSSLGRICFGEKENKILSDKVAAVKEFFDRTGVSYEIPENMLKTLWWKFMINVGINQSSAILRAPYGVFQTVQEARDLMDAAMGEVILLSQKMGINLTEDALTEWYKTLSKLSPSGKTSMLQDVEAGRKTEVEIFGGTICSLGKKHNVPTPVNDMFVKMLSVIEQNK
jgi:2-dehydropantoate 2-reductase